MNPVFNATPCPFCGEQHSIALELNAEEWAIECVSCGTIGPSMNNPVDAWYYWNYRKSPKAPRANRARDRAAA